MIELETIAVHFIWILIIFYQFHVKQQLKCDKLGVKTLEKQLKMMNNRPLRIPFLLKFLMEMSVIYCLWMKGQWCKAWPGMTHPTSSVGFRIPGSRSGIIPTRSMWIKIFSQKLSMRKMPGKKSFLIQIWFILTIFLLP